MSGINVCILCACKNLWRLEETVFARTEVSEGREYVGARNQNGDLQEQCVPRHGRLSRPFHPFLLMQK